MNNRAILSATARGGRSRLEGQPLVLVCGADDGFAKTLAVALYSALLNYSGPLPVSVYVIDGGIGTDNRARLDRIVRKLGVAIEWIEPDWGPVRHLAVSERYPASTYLRLLIPAFLPNCLVKAIYLDSDLIVHGNIAELWDADLGGNPLLAVQDKGVPTVGSSRSGLANYRELGLDPSAKYFNSGVLVFDLWAWRKRRLDERVIDYIAAHPSQTGFGEQDALNAVLAAEWGGLEARWNQQVWAWDADAEREYRSGILHFVFTSKPWTPAGAHWTNFLYDRYLRRSGWYGAVEWWTYYFPLLVRRQQVLRTRSRRPASAQPRTPT
jgi:lipopolysaccharide biosynthesis glycosyltransferase